MMTPAEEYFRTFHRRPERLLKGLDAKMHGVIGCYHRRPRVLQTLRRDAELIDCRPGIFGFVRPSFGNDCASFESFPPGRKESESLISPALAAIREAADRQVGLRPFLSPTHGSPGAASRLSCGNGHGRG